MFLGTFILQYLQLMSQVKKFAKLFTFTCVVSIVIFFTLIFYDFIVNYSSDSKEKVIPKRIRYILLWTDKHYSPLRYLKTKAFIDNNCEYTNCYVTHKRNYIKDLTLFDSIVFNGRNRRSNKLNRFLLPKPRSHKQKYVYATLESSQTHPVCLSYLDDFFNWTWTYRLDSDVAWSYFVVYNNDGVAIAPSKTVRWIKTDTESAEIGDELKEKVNSKTKAAAWFASNCKTASKRENYVDLLRRSLVKYNLDVDIYGWCGEFKCWRNQSEACNKKLAKDYYFYLAFENSLAEDYVTEKVLTAVNYDTVPVVFGGANYTRFLPPGSYLNAMELSPKKLAEIMHQIISDPNKQRYYNFFKWRKYYHFKDSKRMKVCDICALMNNWSKVNVRSSYENFRKWWNPPVGNLCA